MMRQKQFEGFTIVELLIVIVVIGILAAITIVSFNGVSGKAKVAAAQSSLNSAKKQVEIAKTTAGSDSYPASVPGLDSNVTYTSNTALGGYCLVNSSVPNTPYMVTSSNGVPHPGPSTITNGCQIQNIVTNPSFEFNNFNWDQGQQASITRTTDPANVSSGVGAGILTRTSSVAGEGYTGMRMATTVGARYSVSFALKNQSGTPAIIASVRNFNKGWSLADNASVSITPAASFVRYALNWTAQDTTSFLLIENMTTVANSAVAIDSVIATEGENSATYIDPDLKPGSGWAWDGTAGSSTSKGPAF
jgi:prepilin-type N-terminal cleavage/methylation domain-containing protein